MSATMPTRDTTPVASPEQPTMRSREWERLSAAQRFGEVVGIFFTGIMTLLFFGFFVYHQAAGTGFFTAKFGLWEAILFYSPMALAFAAPLTRALTGRRNPGRLVEAMTNLVQAIAATWLVIVFPFNFAHLADALPITWRFALVWVSDDIARVMMIAVIFICLFAAIVRVVQFIYHASRESNAPPGA